MTLWFTMCSPGCVTGGHQKKSVAGYPTISRTTRGCESVTKPYTRGFMGPAGRSDNCGNTCPEVIRNAGNGPEGESKRTGSDGVCRFMTAPWTSNPGPRWGMGDQTALLVQGTLVEYIPVWNANPGLSVGQKSLQSPRRPPGGRSTECFPSCPPTRSPL